MTFIENSTGWFEVVKVSSIDKISVRVLQLCTQTWLCKYPRPKRVSFDNDSEFKKNFISLINDVVIKT